MKLEIPFEFGEKVFIETLNKEGRIISIHYSKYGTEITVKYVNGDEVKYNDFFPDELKLVKEVTCGFGGLNE